MLTRRAPRRPLRADRAGSISIMMAVMAPALLLTIGVGIEVSRWTLVKQELQRTADIAALAGATEFVVSANPQNAANAAADLADLNGATANTTRTWTLASRTLTANQITVQIGPSARNASNTGVKVTVSQLVPFILTGALNPAATGLTVSASSWAELSVSQSCMVALGGNDAGIVFNGVANATFTGCSINSNSGITMAGVTNLTATSIWAAGSIVASGVNTITGATHPNSAPIVDPYAADARVAAAFSAINLGPRRPDPNLSFGTITLNPGTYSSWSFSGVTTVNLNPGRYYVNGPITISGVVSLIGHGVTIVTSGAIAAAGVITMDLTAALADPNLAIQPQPTDPALKAIPGLVFAGTSNQSAAFSGVSSMSIAGMMYYPNGALVFAGVPQTGSARCFEVIARSLTMAGVSATADNCAAYGTPTFGNANGSGLVK